MNPVLLYNIIDPKGNVIFKFPPNILLEKITDVWPLIIDYYENYYPFAVGNPDQNYREVTLEESKTNGFIKLFSAICMNDRITEVEYPFHGSISISIGGHLLNVIGGIHNNSTIWVGKDILRPTGIKFMHGMDNIKHVYVNESLLKYNRTIPLLVLSHIVFN